MSDWQMTLDFTPAKSDYRAGKITIQQLAQKVVDTIKVNIETAKRIDDLMGKELEDEILPLFEEIAADETMTVDDYDNALDDLYDWADTKLSDGWPRKAMCWIKP